MSQRAKSRSQKATRPKKPNIRTAKPKAATKASPKGPNLRWFYDVRQYALLTDATGRLLILQLPAKYDEGTANTWTLPGGKLEPADDPQEGLAREIREETGLSATVHGPVRIARWSTRASKKLAIFYRATVEGESPKPRLSHEHQRFAWVLPSELTDFPFHRPDMCKVAQSQKA